jgi:hypothetical protein
MHLALRHAGHQMAGSFVMSLTTPALDQASIQQQEGVVQRSEDQLEDAARELDGARLTLFNLSVQGLTWVDLGSLEPAEMLGPAKVLQREAGEYAQASTRLDAAAKELERCIERRQTALDYLNMMRNLKARQEASQRAKHDRSAANEAFTQAVERRRLAQEEYRRRVAQEKEACQALDDIATPPYEYS